MQATRFQTKDEAKTFLAVSGYGDRFGDDLYPAFYSDRQVNPTLGIHESGWYVRNRTSSKVMKFEDSPRFSDSLHTPQRDFSSFSTIYA